MKGGGSVMFETLPEVLTLKQCQELLQIGRTTILGMIKQNEFKAFKVRGCWRIRKDDFGVSVFLLIHEDAISSLEVLLKRKFTIF